jgi:hypothetical protein
MVTLQPAPDAGSDSGDRPLTVLGEEPGHATARLSALAPVQLALTVPALVARRWYCAEIESGARSQPCSTCSALGAVLTWRQVCSLAACVLLLAPPPLGALAVGMVVGLLGEEPSGAASSVAVLAEWLEAGAGAALRCVALLGCAAGCDGCARTLVAIAARDEELAPGAPWAARSTPRRPRAIASIVHRAPVPGIAPPRIGARYVASGEDASRHRST